MARYVKPGEVIDFLNEGEKLLEGDMVTLGAHGIGVAASTIEIHAVGSVYTTGVWEIPKTTEAVPLGAKLFYDAASGKVCTTDTGVHAGWAVQNAAVGDSTATVKIG